MATYTCKSCQKQYRTMRELIKCLEGHVGENVSKSLASDTEVVAGERVYRIIAQGGEKHGKPFLQNGEPVNFQSRLDATAKMIEIAKSHKLGFGLAVKEIVLSP